MAELDLIYGFRRNSARKFLLFIVSLLIVYSEAMAEEIDRSVIAMQARIYPQIIFFSSKVKEVSQKRQVTIIAVYDDGNKKNAEAFKEEAERIYKEGISGFKINVRPVSIDKLQKERENTAFYVLFDEENSVQNIHELKNSITFAATKKIFVKNGTMFFAEITNKTSILLNKRAFTTSSISFEPALLKMVKVYDEN